MVAWAKALEVESRSWPGAGYGQIVLTTIGGVPVAGIVQKHDQTGTQGAWHDCPRGASLIDETPCCHAVTLYHPPPFAVPAPGPLARTRPSFMEIAFLGLAVFGTTFAASRAYFAFTERRKNPDANLY
jgi:hypothetical protein